MNSSQQQHELSTIYNEYSTYFSKCLLNLDQNYIEIITKEGDELKVVVSNQGWSIKNSNPLVYETFEALLQTISPSFRDKFGNELANRLNLLLQQEDD
ncbi:uncharacterized protein KGF55_002228 [Candida pseudojiufengensis]|uniref:uncharacterized protein n=1 Tax=Candida pseudojiufengensis TaxID=497109 RepID=UPI002225B5F1|nr:uncharacterized protein KGF55_002228 [Candida pseudojiufengensis]KAI5964286.1 hypothetical protein KGF55_002228 [Candida pseudojiufengensis]